MNQFRRMFQAALAFPFLCGVSEAALAQSTTPPQAETTENGQGLSEIVVTASRRDNNVQDVSIAVTALSGDSLRNAGVTDPRQLSGLAPSLMVDQGLTNGQTHVTIRGQTSTSFQLEASSPAAIYVDDVFQPFQFGIGTQLFDLQRVEVLRGPQGTLFGKNTTAGSVNFFSITPTRRDEGYFTVDLSGGDFGKYAVEGAFNKTLTPDLSSRLSFRVEHRDGYVKNLVGGSDLGEYNNYSGRLQFKWTPGSSTTINLKIYGQKNTGDGPIYILNNYNGDPCDPIVGLGAYFLCDANGKAPALGSNSREATSEVATFENYDNYGATLNVAHSFGAFDLTSITNYQGGSYSVQTNDDGAPGDFFHSRQSSDTMRVSQEFRLSTPASKPLRAIIGAYGEYDRITSVQGSLSSGLPAASIPFEYTILNRARTTTTTFAGFASVTYDLTSRLGITGGLRYTSELQKAFNYEQIKHNNVVFDANFIPVVILDRDITDQYFDFSVAQSNVNPLTDTVQKFSGRSPNHKLTWDATVNFKPTDKVLVYAKAGTGFRSGGFFSAPDTSQFFVTALKPENVTAYELGFKSEFLDNTVRFNAAAYWIDYKDMQVQVANQSNIGFGFKNASTARIKGVEAELQIAPIRNLKISGSIGYNDARYREYKTLRDGLPVDYAGNMLPYSSKWTASWDVGYIVPVGASNKLTLNTNWTYRSKIFFQSGEEAAISDKGRVIGNVRIGFGAENGSWELAAYVNNILNEDPVAFAFSVAAVTPRIYAPKRTAGGQLAFRF